MIARLRIKYSAISLGIAAFLLGMVSCTPATNQEYKLINKVNPFIGTAPLTDTLFIGYTPPKGWRVWAGLTYPGVSLPNAMVQLSPITKFGSGAGYEYEDTVIQAFTHTNLGHWNLCHVPALPVTGPGLKTSSLFSHDQEKAIPGYYQVFLKDFDINVELTSTLRCGYHRYEYPEGAVKKLIFNLARSNERVRGWEIVHEGPSSISGFQQTGRKVFFYAVFNQDMDQLVEKTTEDPNYSSISFTPDVGRTLEMKIGLSFVSAENAKENLESEIGDKSFDQVKNEAFAIWENHLKKIEVTGGAEKQHELFYSSLYRAFLWPALRSDVNGEYADVKGDVVQGDFNYYTTPALWDTYRNKLVLLGMLSPEVASDIIKSLIDIGEKTGFIPTYFHGDHAAVFIAGSYLRGVSDFDVAKAYKLLLNNATLEGGTRPYIKEYMEKGYIPEHDIPNPHVETKATAGVTKTLEYAYDDYAIALLAGELKDTVVYHNMMQRSQNYRNLFDKSTGFMRGRLADGSWIKNFDPQYPYYEYMYREANAWQSTFFAPHDVEGLIELFGGEEHLEAKLDSLFTIPWNRERIARNISSFIGQYCHGNQPDHNYPYLYYFVGKQEKSQEILDTLMNHYYGVGEHGWALSGMDDAGEMSSWYVFNAMGFYPFSPADDEYIVTVPLFERIDIQAPDAAVFSIRKNNQGRKITGLKLNSNKLEGYKLSHKHLRERGILEIY